MPPHHEEIGRPRFYGQGKVPQCFLTPSGEPRCQEGRTSGAWGQFGFCTSLHFCLGLGNLKQSADCHWLGENLPIRGSASWVCFST